MCVFQYYSVYLYICWWNEFFTGTASVGSHAVDICHKFSPMTVIVIADMSLDVFTVKNLHVSVCPHVQIQEMLNWFLLNLIFESFTKIYWYFLCLTELRQQGTHISAHTFWGWFTRYLLAKNVLNWSYSGTWSTRFVLKYTFSISREVFEVINLREWTCQNFAVCTFPNLLIQAFVYFLQLLHLILWLSSYR